MKLLIWSGLEHSIGNVSRKKSVFCGCLLAKAAEVQARMALISHENERK
jgi:hypothetical protein